MICIILLSGCQSTKVSTNDEHAEKLTAGTIQLYIQNGMSSAEVVSALGAPNMVTRNPDGTETWVYDKISSNFKTSKSNSRICLMLFGGDRTRSSGSSESRTLTVVIHFDKDYRVADFSYRTTSF